MSNQGTSEWHNDRLGKVTASMMHNVMMSTTTAGYNNYAAQLVCERLTGEPTETFVSADMQHGTETEPQARATYTLDTGNSVAEVGFIDHLTIPMSGASPDGLIGELGLVEIKCPKPATHIKTLTSGKIDRKYMLQMQWQMECTGRLWCDFVSFCPALGDDLALHILRVEADFEIQREMRDTVTEFLSHVELLHQRLLEVKEAA